jgi:hypothetical protein
MTRTVALLVLPPPPLPSLSPSLFFNPCELLQVYCFELDEGHRVCDGDKWGIMRIMRAL